MKRLLVAFGVVALASMVACGSSSTGTGGGSGGSAGGGTGGGSSAGGGTGGGTAGGSGGGTAGGSGGGTAGGSGGGTAGGSGGGTAGGAGGGAAGGAGGGTAGGAGGGTADAGMPPLITLTFMPMCNTLTACGGDVVGTWHYNSGCVSSDTLFGSARQLCPALTLSNLSGDSRGAVTFDATDVTRSITTNLAGSMMIPATCNITGNCTQVQTALANGFKTVTCTGGAGACMCDFTVTVATTGKVPYTKGTNQFTTDPGTGQAKTYDYCINGTGNTVFTYRELGNNPRDPGIFAMSKK